MVLLDLRHKVYYLVVSLNDIVAHILNLCFKYEPQTEKDKQQYNHYTSYDHVKYVAEYYYKAIDHCHTIENCNKIIDFGCGLGIGEHIFNTMFQDSYMEFKSYGYNKPIGIYDFFLKQLNISPIGYDGDINDKNFIVDKALIPADAIMCFRLIVQDYAIENFINNNMMTKDTTLVYTYSRPYKIDKRSSICRDESAWKLNDFQITNPAYKKIKIL
jgi:hypothetical protein